VEAQIQAARAKAFARIAAALMELGSDELPSCLLWIKSPWCSIGRTPAYPWSLPCWTNAGNGRVGKALLDSCTVQKSSNLTAAMLSLGHRHHLRQC